MLLVDVRIRNVLIEDSLIDIILAKSLILQLLAETVVLLDHLRIKVLLNSEVIGLLTELLPDRVLNVPYIELIIFNFRLGDDQQDAVLQFCVALVLENGHQKLKLRGDALAPLFEEFVLCHNRDDFDTFGHLEDTLVQHLVDDVNKHPEAIVEASDIDD